MKTDSFVNYGEKMTLQGGWLLGRSVVWPFSRLTRWLRIYYGSVLEREVSTREMWQLTRAQVAFVLGVMPADCPLLWRVACGLWLVGALSRFRTSGQRG